MAELKIGLTFKLNSSFHSTGDIVSIKVDKSLSKDSSGNVLIPATLIKGTLRHNIEMLLRALGENVCLAPSPEEMCNKCIICKSFGSPSNKAKLFFSDGKIPLDKAFLQTQTGTTIHRRTKTVKEEALFSTEVSFYEDEFDIEISGFFETEDEAMRIAGLVLMGSRANFSIGGNKSRGLGWLELKEFKVSINDQAKDSGEIENTIREWLK